MQTVQVAVGDEGEVVRAVAERAWAQVSSARVDHFVLGSGTIYQSLDDLAYPGDRFYLSAQAREVLVQVVGPAVEDVGAFSWRQERKSEYA